MFDNDGSGGGWQNPNDDRLRELLKDSRTIAVVGLSSNPERPSYGVSSYLLSQGYNVIPVNPREKEILGQKAYPDLKSINEKVDIVDVFRKPDAVPDIVREAIEINVKAVWLQEQVISLSAFKKGVNNGLIMVMDRCILKEHRRLVV